jgi:hypothetical protein
MELQKTNGQTLKKKSKCILEKNERTNILKNSKMQFGEKTNGQTFRKTAKCACSLEKNRMDKHLEKQTCTHVV